MIEDKKNCWVLSRYLSLAASLASGLARSRGLHEVGIPEFFAGCYIADPARLLSFWVDAWDCTEAIVLDCDLIDPVLLYQHTLLTHFQSELKEQGWSSSRYGDDLKRALVRAAEAQTVASIPQIDLPQFLLVVCNDSRLSRVFKAGFRGDLARQRAGIVGA